MFKIFTVSPNESGIIDQHPTPRMKRGLTLMCKIMQNIANHVLFTKEQHMRPFNDFLKQNFDAGRRYLIRLILVYITSYFEFFIPVKSK